jgi:hypothetical protein
VTQFSNYLSALIEANLIRFYVILKDIVRVEAAVAIGCICLENPDNLTAAQDTLKFNYSNLYKLSRSKIPAQQSLARYALSLFAFGNLTQQRLMANFELFVWSTFESNLKLNASEIDRCECAFQVIVLAPLIHDIGHANAIAYGIQTLIDLLSSDYSTVSVKILAAEKLSILAKLKNGKYLKISISKATNRYEKSQ